MTEFNFELSKRAKASIELVKLSVRGADDDFVDEILIKLYEAAYLDGRLDGINELGLNLMGRQVDREN